MKALIGVESVLARVEDGLFYFDENMMITPAALDLLQENRVMFMTGLNASTRHGAQVPCGAPACMHCGACDFGHSDGSLEARVRNILSRQVARGDHAYEKIVDEKSGVLCVKAATVLPEPFDTGEPGGTVYLSDVVTEKESPRLGFGIMEIKGGASFRYTLAGDRVKHIIEGTLEVCIDGRTVTAEKGDTLFVPKHSTLTLSTPGFVRFLFVTCPTSG